MNNRTKLYVIGLSQSNLLEVYTHPVYTREQGYIDAIQQVFHGVDSLYHATHFCHIEFAQRILQEIKDNRNTIRFTRDTILESVIEGNDLDVDALHIYEVDMRITREVM